MSKHIEKTLVLLKPDAVERGLIGRIVERFENAGLKIVGLKMIKPTEELVKKHYTEDVAIRRGEHIRNFNVKFLTSGPVVAIALEGINAIENVRKMCGPTEPKAAAPGTIRGDFAHMGFGYCDDKKITAINVIHASADEQDAKAELGIWFASSETVEYKTVHEKHMR